MYHFRSFPGIQFLSSSHPFSAHRAFRLSPRPVAQPIRLVVFRPAVPIVWRAACPCRYCLRSFPPFGCVATCHRVHALACYPMMPQAAHASPMSVSPRPPCRLSGESSGEPRSADVVEIELTKTAHPVIRLCRNCVVPASPHSVHIIYMRTRYYVFIKRRSRWQCPMDVDIGSEIFRNEGISS